MNAWTADTRNSTRRDWRWAKMKDEYIKWPQDRAELDENEFGSRASHTSAYEISCDSDIIQFLDDQSIKETCNRLEKYSEDKLAPYDDITGEMIQLQPIKWNPIRVETLNSTSWYAEIPPTSNGFRALMIEVTFQGPDDKSGLTFTTEVMITPDVRPFKRCKGEACYSFLI